VIAVATACAQTSGVSVEKACSKIARAKVSTASTGSPGGVPSAKSTFPSSSTVS
jgi:hypothetical protein